MQARGVRDILAVDLAQPMLDALAQKHPPPGAAILGNEAGVSDTVHGSGYKLNPGSMPP